MEHILGLDISTSCTGWCIMSLSGSFVDMGYISLDAHEKTFQKAHAMSKELSRLQGKYNVKQVAIEENLQAFRPGFSSAKTLLTLARFNGIVSYLSQEHFLVEPEFINVNVARKLLGIKVISKKKGGKPTKEQILDWVNSQVNYSWPVKILKSGPRKGDSILEPGCFDAADAYVIAAAAFKLFYLKSK